MLNQKSVNVFILTSSLAGNSNEVSGFPVFDHKKTRKEKNHNLKENAVKHKRNRSIVRFENSNSFLV